MDNWLGLTFARPSALWLLLALPFVAGLGAVFGLRRRRFTRSALLLRLLAVAMLALALAEPLTAHGGNAANTIFVVDRSLSATSGEGSSGVERWLDDALKASDPSDRAAVIAFGSSPIVANSIARSDGITADLQSSTEQTGPAYTNLESALALARALPVGGSRRIVVVSDGAENLGAALNQAGQAATDGTLIDVLPLAGVSQDDLRVEGASAPNSVWIGETVQVLASIATGSGGESTVELLVDGVSQATTAAILNPGLNTFTFQVPGLPAGFHALTVRVASTVASDTYAENNALPIALIVRDAPKLLLVAPAGSDPGNLQRALEARDSVVTLITPDRISSRLSDLTLYDAVILDNVPASSLTIDQMTGLQEATRKYGKGLVVIGGTSSYGPGGYAGTLLEETLPVTVKVTDGRQRQHVALLLIVDKSGSMSFDPSGQTSKIDMAKDAIRLAAESLSDGDQLGVLAFSDDQQWVVKFTTIDGQASRDQINAAIEGIKADGGTEIYPALQVGFDAIANVTADVRHVVLLSDGKSRSGTPESYEKMIDQAIVARTTLSTIAIGEDADVDLLQDLALRGNGRYHFTTKPEDIPRLTLADTKGIGSQSVITGTFNAIQSEPSPIMTGFKPEDLPELEGYDYAEPKPDAQVVLTSERDDPVLAVWQLGLGRVVAWTSDAGADLAYGWAEWDRYGEFWGNVVRWALPDPENRPVAVTVTRQGPEAIVTINSVGQDGAYVDLATTTATIVGPDGATTRDIQLYQSGPGEYQFRAQAPKTGAYRIDLTQQRQSGTINELAAFTMPPSPELQPSSSGNDLLRTIAARTGGRVLSLDDPQEAISDEGLTGSALRDYSPVWYVPLAFGLLALLAELAIRMQFLSRLGFTWPRRPLRAA